MPVVHTPGIVLKRRNFSEADRILTLYTRKLGKVTAKAKGVRRPLSKLAGHLELLTQSNVGLAEGKTWFTLTEAVTISAYPKIRASLPLLSLACYIGELVEKLTHDHEPQPQVYDLLAQVLGIINDKNKDILLPAFIWRLMGLTGYKPELYRCVQCREKLTLGNLYFSLEKGGLLDEAHHHCDLQARLVTVEVVKLMRIILTDLDLAMRVDLNPKDLAEFSQIVDIFSQLVLENRPKSYAFYQENKVNQ